VIQIRNARLTDEANVRAIAGVLLSVLLIGGGPVEESEPAGLIFGR
jgi:hypothetical protein